MESNQALSLDIVDEVNPESPSCVWEADANTLVPACTTADVKSDMSEDEWECPSRETALPFTVMSETAISLTLIKSNEVAAYRSDPLYILCVSYVK
jgi:hypothetical protein